MDPAIAALISAQNAALCTQIQYALTAKSLDNMELQGQAVNQLLADAAQLSKDLILGRNFDAVG